jgi:hypothetical protein
VVYALVEGLAGVVDRGVVFDALGLEPRWTAAGVDQAEVAIRYPASGGYAAYRYQHDRAARTIRLEVTGSGKTAECRILLPEEATVIRSVALDGKAVEGQAVRLEGSLYAGLFLALSSAHTIEVQYDA